MPCLSQAVNLNKPMFGFKNCCMLHKKISNITKSRVYCSIRVHFYADFGHVNDPLFMAT